MRENRPYRKRAVAALGDLRGREVNYPPMEGRPPTLSEGWHVDSLCHRLALEPPGDPVPGGPWHIACRLVRGYQFAEPRILRGLYRRDDPLLGRNMLMEGKFAGLRFDMGVRVTSVIDRVEGSGEGTRRVWGWGYQTLQGHLEEGELRYKVRKQLTTGAVDFLITGYSRRAKIPNPLVRAGFMAFGRVTQQRFYWASARRLHRLLRAELRGAPPVPAETHPDDEGIVIAPSLGRGRGRRRRRPRVLNGP
jgi:uncharacterized protein (UPF0548 family)